MLSSLKKKNALSSPNWVSGAFCVMEILMGQLAVWSDGEWKERQWAMHFPPNYS